MTYKRDIAIFTCHTRLYTSTISEAQRNTKNIKNKTMIDSLKKVRKLPATVPFRRIGTPLYEILTFVRIKYNNRKQGGGLHQTIRG